MRRLVGAALGCLPLDVRARRAFDETLDDWKHEEAEANTVPARWGTGARALVAVGRTFFGVVGQEVHRVPYPWLAGQVLLFAALPATVIVVVTYQGLPQLFDLATPVRIVELTVLSIAHEAEVLLPLAFFIAVTGSRGRHRLPLLGLGLLAGTFTFLFSGWLEPAANQRFSQLATETWQVSHPGQRFMSGHPEMSLGQVIAARDSAPYVFLRLFSFKTGLGPLAATLVLLGGTLTARFKSLGGGWLCAAAVAYLGAFVLLTGNESRLQYVAAWPGLVPLFVALLLVLTAWLVAGRHLSLRTVVPAVGLLVAGWSLLPGDWLVLYRVLVAGFTPWMMAAIAAAITLRIVNQAISSRPVKSV